MKSRTTLLLGAGASRAVSYASMRSIPSPLDSDFFELLQRVEPSAEPLISLSELIQWVLANNYPIWHSMELIFYTLHTRARMTEVLFPDERFEMTVERLHDLFSQAIDVLLREAHGKEFCEFHVDLLRHMKRSDAIVTVNYDLVVERALKELARTASFGNWLYGFETRPKDASELPTLHKLHGSVNWIYEKGRSRFTARQTSWTDFDEKPGYRGHRSLATSTFPIMLPYWEKKVEDEPWKGIWNQAASHLRKTARLIVWGYSLPRTDLKTQELVRLSMSRSGSLLRDVCVIDPSAEVRTRWRGIFADKKFWQYTSIAEFREDPPNWWPGFPRSKG